MKSDFIENAFFTTREICICDKAAVSSQSTSSAAEKVISENTKIIENYLHKKLVSPIQTHSSNVVAVKTSQNFYPDTDGLILTDNSQAIFLNFADCTPIILYDQKQNIGAVTHAGWRGTASKIAQKTVKKMASEFNSEPQDICAVIGPTICENCYEVGVDVYKNFYSVSESSSQKYHLNLKEINAKQLAEVGVQKIDLCPYCTCCDNEYFFSYRKENGTTLRHSALLFLK